MTVNKTHLHQEMVYLHQEMVLSDSYFCVELCEDLEVLLEVCGKNGLNDEEPKAFELCLVQMNEPVELRLCEEEAPHRRCVVTLQHRPVIVENSLWCSENGRYREQYVVQGERSL